MTIGSIPVPPEPNRYWLALIGECFVDGRIWTNGWEARPLSILDPIYIEAIDAFVKETGTTGDVDALRAARHGRQVDLVALLGRIPAGSPEEAIQLGEPHARAVFRALQFRQVTPGRILALIAFPELPDTGSFVKSDFRKSVNAYYKNAETGAPMEPDEAGQHVDAIGRLIEASPVGPTLADLFLSALADVSPEGSIVRLWSLLETMASNVDDPKPTKGRLRELRIVTAAMGQLGLDQELSYADAYHVRNAFLHQGQTDNAKAPALQMSLIRAAFAALLRTGFRPVDPAAPPFVDDPNARPLRVDFDLDGPPEPPSDEEWIGKT